VLTRKRLQRQLSKLRCVDGCSSSQTDQYLTGKQESVVALRPLSDDVVLCYRTVANRR